jgi:hypothetical protein
MANWKLAGNFGPGGAVAAHLVAEKAPGQISNLFCANVSYLFSNQSYWENEN